MYSVSEHLVAEQQCRKVERLRDASGEAWRGNSPPILTTAEITLASAGMTARNPFTLLYRTRFIYHQCAAHQLRAITRSNCLLGGSTIIDLHESPSFAAEMIAKDAHTPYRYTGLLEKRLNVATAAL